ncbi:restriction endonuclease [uncultured Dokdonia sp.]|uniref:restriction endonuclease n=1 Tax=uncultured Dokdonia sp. TaxID=575653 RepID=UPI002604C89D|nr:restriction endonuclease [uncultured Dokdonia sp.]
MRPDEYEHIVADYFEAKGYKTTVSQYSNDYGVDVFATKGKEKIAIQAKMFGGSTRPINRQMVMELHGAKDYFDCSKAIIATNGRVIDNALEVANKLKIEILSIPAIRTSNNRKKRTKSNSFEIIWEKYVMPLEGKKIKRADGKTNKIITVDWSGIQRITSNGKPQRIKIEIFKKTINHLLKNGEITRSYINEEYKDRASSGIVLILGNTEIFELTNRPTGLKMKK